MAAEGSDQVREVSSVFASDRESVAKLTPPSCCFIIRVSMAYRPGLPNVLKNVSFDILPGEKIGIVRSSR
jgi:ABC-type multidrug transport system fused ATPase/permease subunit